MGIGLRRAGRWDAADQVTKKIEEVWDFGVVPATEFLGSGALQSPVCQMCPTCLTPVPLNPVPPKAREPFFMLDKPISNK